VSVSDAEPASSDWSSRLEAAAVSLLVLACVIALEPSQSPTGLARRGRDAVSCLDPRSECGGELVANARLSAREFGSATPPDVAGRLRKERAAIIDGLLPDVQP
jgi:hypothetical protein